MKSYNHPLTFKKGDFIFPRIGLYGAGPWKVTQVTRNPHRIPDEIKFVYVVNNHKRIGKVLASDAILASESIIDRVLKKYL